MDMKEVNCRNAKWMELNQNNGFSNIDSFGSATMKLLSIK
jgi:hypothetical protein